MGVTLIAPCKGIDPGFEENVKAVLAQQYRDFWEVIFVVESEDDPAYAVLNRINDDAWLKKRGKRGRERVIELFSVKVGGRETEKVYKKAMK